MYKLEESNGEIKDCGSPEVRPELQGSNGQTLEVAGIELGRRYSIPILRHLQTSEEAIEDVRNARATLMREMDLPHERKGTRLGVQDALDELESKDLITMSRDPNRNAAKTRGIALTEAGRNFVLPLADTDSNHSN